MIYNEKTINITNENGKFVFEIPELSIRQDEKPMIGGSMATETEAETVAMAYIDYRTEIDGINSLISAYMQKKQNEIETVEKSYREKIS